MDIDREEIVHYTIGLLLSQDDNDRYFYTKDHIAYAIGISPNTLDLYLISLKKKGLIDRKKKKYERDISKLITLTMEGRKHLKEMEEKFDQFLLTPERHNIPTCVSISTILNRIDDPLERTFFLSVLGKNKRFDLPMLLESLKVSKQETSLINVLSSMDGEEAGTVRSHFMETFDKSCFYGSIDKEQLRTECMERSDINSLLVIAEAFHKQGKLSEARSIYDHILAPGANITQHQWFQAHIGMAHVTRKEGKSEEAVALLDNVIEQTDDKIYHAYAREVQAWILSTLGRQDEAKRLFKSALGAFKNYGIPIFTSITLNNRGIMNFRLGDNEQAEKDWKKARKYARDAGSDYSEAFILCNLADIALLKDNFELARKYLDRTMTIFSDYGDYNGKAAVEFNLALLYLQMKELEKAKEHFALSESVAFPLPSPPEREERRKVFLERAEKNGFRDVDIEPLLFKGQRVDGNKNEGR